MGRGAKARPQIDGGRIRRPQNLAAGRRGNHGVTNNANAKRGIAVTASNTHSVAVAGPAANGMANTRADTDGVTETTLRANSIARTATTTRNVDVATADDLDAAWVRSIQDEAVGFSLVKNGRTSRDPTLTGPQNANAIKGRTDRTCLVHDARRRRLIRPAAVLPGKQRRPAAMRTLGPRPNTARAASHPIHRACGKQVPIGVTRTRTGTHGAEILSRNGASRSDANGIAGAGTGTKGGTGGSVGGSITGTAAASADQTPFGNGIPVPDAAAFGAARGKTRADGMAVARTGAQRKTVARTLTKRVAMTRTLANRIARTVTTDGVAVPGTSTNGTTEPRAGTDRVRAPRTSHKQMTTGTIEGDSTELRVPAGTRGQRTNRTIAVDLHLDNEKAIAGKPEKVPQRADHIRRRRSRRLIAQVAGVQHAGDPGTVDIAAGSTVAAEKLPNTEPVVHRGGAPLPITLDVIPRQKLTRSRSSSTVRAKARGMPRSTLLVPVGHRVLESLASDRPGFPAAKGIRRGDRVIGPSSIQGLTRRVTSQGPETKAEHATIYKFLEDHEGHGRVTIRSRSTAATRPRKSTSGQHEATLRDIAGQAGA